MHFGSQLLFKSVQAAHLAALVAWHAKNRGDRLGGLVFRDEQHIELKPRSRKAGVLHYLHALTTLNNQTASTSAERQTTASSINEANPIGQTDLESTEKNTEHKAKGSQSHHNFEQHCARLRHVAKPGTLVYLITDGYALLDKKSCRHALRHLSKISQHCELVVCLISDPLEQTLPDSAIKLAVTLTDGKNRQQLTLGDKTTALHYQQQALELNTKMQSQLQSAGARVIHFSAGQSLEQQLKSSGASF
jgi:uncharacterized protein (DUF58 family)